MSLKPLQSSSSIPLSCLTVMNADASIDFYERAFGFTRQRVIADPEGRTRSAEVEYHGGVIGLRSGDPLPAISSSPVGLYVYCDDADAVYERATAAGAGSLIPPTNAFWGDRYCTVTDPDGHHWTFATGLDLPRAG